MGDSPNIPLVSIITPCYNGEKFVHRFLDSVLDQTHDNIELIFVNDGSTDRTEEIVQGYKNKFNEKGIKFIYIYQENKGQAAAINKGLKIFKGEYLIWPDSDDILHKDNLRLKVEYLENFKKCGIVVCNGRVLSEDMKDVKARFRRDIRKYPMNTVFSDLILETNIFIACGCYMVRREALIKSIKNKEIYESRGGQNWQLLLPIVYNFKCGYIDKYLYDMIFRHGSHSRSDKGLDQILKRIEVHEDILKNTISRISEMPEKEKNDWYESIENKYLRRKLSLAAEYKNIKKLDEIYSEMKSRNHIRIIDRCNYYAGKYLIIRHLKNIFVYVKQKKTKK